MRIFLSPQNPNSKREGNSKKHTVVGKAVLTDFVINSVSIQDSLEATKLSSTEISESGLSET